MRKWFLLALVLALSACSVFKSSPKKIKVLMKTTMGDIELEMFDDIAPKTVENFIGLAEGTKGFINPKTNKADQKPFYDGLTFHRVIPNFMIQGGCPIGTGTGGPGYKFEDEIFLPAYKIGKEIKSNAEANFIFSSILLPFIQKVGHQNLPDDLKKILDEVDKAKSMQPLRQKTGQYYLDLTHTKELIYEKPIRAEVAYGTLCMANAGPNTNGSQFFIVSNKLGCEWLNGKHTVFGKVTKGMNVVHKIENVKRDRRDKPVNPVKIISIRTME